MAQSARGLFRATGKKPKPTVQMLDGELVRVDEGLPRAEDDFNPTPPEPVRAFLHAELPRIRELGGMVWENAAGDGAIVRELEAVGLKVFASDLIDRGCRNVVVQDFYTFPGWPSWDGLNGAKRVTIGNPPYSETNWRDGQARWLYHTLDTLAADYCAYLLPWPFPGAAGLAGFWHRFPPARVYLCRWKIDFTGQGAPPMLNGWFVWDGPTREGDTRLLMLDRKDARQEELFA